MLSLGLSLWPIFLIYVQLAGACDLFWSSRQSLGYEQGIQLSMCSDRPEPTIGWVGAKPGVKCNYSTGQTLNIPHGALPIPDWYVICYKLHNGCQTCRLDILCENDLTAACADKFILGSSPRASNDSIDYWIKAGDNYPFPTSSHIELSTTVQRSSATVDVQIVSISAGEKKRLVVDGLNPNEVYDIRRCVEIRLPSSLTDDPRFSFRDTTSRLCSEEGYRTQPNSAELPYSIWITIALAIVFSFR